MPSLSFPWHWFPWPSKNWCRCRSNAFQFIHPKLTQWYKIGEDGRPAASLNLHVRYLLCSCIWFSKRPAVHLLTALIPHSGITTYCLMFTRDDKWYSMYFGDLIYLTLQYGPACTVHSMCSMAQWKCNHSLITHSTVLLNVLSPSLFFRIKAHTCTHTLMDAMHTSFFLLQCSPWLFYST